MPNPISCRIAAGKLLDHAADRLSAEERAQLERHLATCSSCRRQVEDYRRLVALMAEAGQTPLPPSRADWQMLAAHMEETSPAQRRMAVRPGIHGRLALAVMAVLALLGIMPGRTAHDWRTKQPQIAPTAHLTPMPSKRLAAVPPPSPHHLMPPGMHTVPYPTPGTRHPHPNNRETEQVRRLLAQAARQIDALERARHNDAQTVLATVDAQGTLPLERRSASVQVTVFTPDQGLVEDHTAFKLNAMTGGTWVRQTLQEQPDGDRATETIAAISGPDRPDGFLNLQTCSTPPRRLEGELQP